MFQLHTESESTGSIVSELTVDANGVGRSTIRGVARMVGVSQPTLTEHFQGDRLTPSKLSQMLMDAGFTGDSLARFAQDGIPDTAIAIIATYYGFEAGRNCTAKARSTVLAFSSIGIRTYIQLHAEPDPTESIVSELTVDAKGVGRCTIRGAARIVGVD
ncbi:hypothetical protein [Leptolyngbya sp. GGD]|uniref:hypothetical protein n=1 Tax=Leptolyngbya sp. GGD TaxID=2997907 RepID=UPI00227A96A5|nr:hypothetical protein [Leptolyngbya sp. GGD]MCY6492133.1 hypothetical protein [Leptolyngbya sp. GGD]